MGEVNVEGRRAGTNKEPFCLPQWSNAVQELQLIFFYTDKGDLNSYSQNCPESRNDLLQISPQ